MIDQSSDSRKTTEITSHNTIIVCGNLLVRLLVLQFFFDIAACFSASKSNAKSPSEKSIFFILAKGMHWKHVHLCEHWTHG